MEAMVVSSTEGSLLRRTSIQWQAREHNGHAGLDVDQVARPVVLFLSMLHSTRLEAEKGQRF
jgi:hypothetical protein